MMRDIQQSETNTQASGSSPTSASSPTMPRPPPPGAIRALTGSAPRGLLFAFAYVFVVRRASAVPVAGRAAMDSLACRVHHGGECATIREVLARASVVAFLLMVLVLFMVLVCALLASRAWSGHDDKKGVRMRHVRGLGQRGTRIATCGCAAVVDVPPPLQSTGDGGLSSDDDEEIVSIMEASLVRGRLERDAKTHTKSRRFAA